MGVNRLLELPRPVIWKDPNLEVTRFPIESNKIIKIPTQNTDMIKIKLTYNKFTMTFTIIKFNKRNKFRLLFLILFGENIDPWKIKSLLSLQWLKELNKK